MQDYNPMQYFQTWLYDVDQNFNEPEPNAMTLVTTGRDGFSNNRIVLLKKYDWKGFYFYTNYHSNKAKDITYHPKVLLLFGWKVSQRKLIVSGIAEKTSIQDSENYFYSRPRGSQIGAWTSRQSAVIDSRKILQDRYLKFENTYKEKEIPKLPFWGGFLVRPRSFTFISKSTDNTNKNEQFIPEENIMWSKTIFFTSLG